MKIYDSVEMDFYGNITVEDSYDYDGELSFAKGGKGGSTSAAPPAPAKRPERVVDITPEEIKLGTADSEDNIGSIKKSGKRSLARPSGSSTASSGLSI